MRNLAGPWSAEKDYAIELELRAAGITVAPGDPTQGEVKTRVAGRLGAISFTRFWYYWVAKGLVPIEMANEMYVDEIGKRAVRAAGDCACRSPETWAQTYATADGFAVCVDTYHIDSQEGLDLFVRMAHKHGIAERPIAAIGWTVESTESILRDATDELVHGYLGKILAKGRLLHEINEEDPRVIDLVRRCREAHPEIQQ